MKNRILLVFLSVVLAVSLVAFAACKAEEAPPIVEEEEEEAPPIVEEEEEEEEVWQWPEKLVITAAAAVGIAAVTGYTAPMSGDTGMKIRVVTRPTVATQFVWVQTGKVFETGEGPPVLDKVLRGDAGHATRTGGPFQMRIAWILALANAGWIVRGDSDIETIYDIKPGTRIVDLVGVPGFWINAQALLAWIGVDEADIMRVPVGAGSTRAITDGRADISWCFPASPETYEAEATPHGIRWLALNAEEDPEGAKRYSQVQPIAAFDPIIQGPPSAIGVWGLAFFCPIVTREETDSELVYHYAQWLDENYDLYKDNHVWNLQMTIDNLMKMVETSFVPVHDGLIKYLKDKGLWTAAHDARQEQNVELITVWVDAFHEAIDMADEQGIMIDPANEEWMELWENYKKGLPKYRMFLGLEE